MKLSDEMSRQEIADIVAHRLLESGSHNGHTKEEINKIVEAVTDRLLEIDLLITKVKKSNETEAGSKIIESILGNTLVNWAIIIEWQDYSIELQNYIIKSLQIQINNLSTD